MELALTMSGLSPGAGKGFFKVGGSPFLRYDFADVFSQKTNHSGLRADIFGFS